MKTSVKYTGLLCENFLQCRTEGFNAITILQSDHAENAAKVRCPWSERAQGRTYGPSRVDHRGEI